LNLNIRKDRDYSKAITFKQLWLKDQFSKLRKVYDPNEVSNDVLKKLLLEEYDKRRLVKGRFFSNTNFTNEVMNQEQFINLYLNSPYILSGYATLYKNQANTINISSAALKFLGDSRKIYKAKMEESEYGSFQYIYYKILQLTFKVLSNSYYGIIGEKNSVFYNPHVQNSITLTGQDLITTAIVTLENFLADNATFNDVNDFIDFITYILDEPKNDNILKYIDIPKTQDELYNYLITKSQNLSDLDKSILYKMVSKLSVEDINRVYYKNKILKLIDDSSFLKNQLTQLLKYEFKEEPEEAMRPMLDSFLNIIKEFCFSDTLFDDRFKQAMTNPRKNIIASDTDSVFINFNNYIIDICKKFNLDETNSSQQMTLVNIFIRLTTIILEKLFARLTENMGLMEKYKPLISMKSEFLYKRILMTRNKKSRQHCSCKISLIAGNPLELLELQRSL